MRVTEFMVRDKQSIHSKLNTSISDKRSTFINTRLPASHLIFFHSNEGNILFSDNIVNLLIHTLGESIEFDHCKINANYHDVNAEAKYPHDYIFESQTSDSVVVGLLMIDHTSVKMTA